MIGRYIWFARASAGNTSKTIDVNVYDGTGGTVGNILDTKTLTMAEVIANTPGIPFIEFDNAIALPASGEVFVGVSFPNLSMNSGDTIAIVTNASGQSNPKIAWEQWSNNSWNTYTNGWGINLTHYMFPWLTNDTTAISLTATPTTICEGEVVHYDATGSTGQHTLLWTFPGMNPQNSNNVTDSVLYNTAGTYTTYLEVVVGGCSRYRIDSVTITVNPAPTPTITATADTICAGTTGSCTGNASRTIYVTNLPTLAASYNPSANICQGATVAFDGTTSTNATSYLWFFPQGNPSISSVTNPIETLTFANAGTHSFSLQVTSDCGTDTYNGTITISAAPTVTAKASATSICAGDPVTLTGGGASTYNWDNGVTDGVAFTPTATTTYTVTGTTGSCSSTDQFTVTVNQLPSAVVTFTPSTNICENTVVQFDASSSTGASSYNWSFSQGGPSISSSGIVNPQVSFSQAGTHNFAVVITNSCGTDTYNGSIVVDICQGIDDLNGIKSLVTYYNNYNNTINLVYANITHGLYNFYITNALGQIVEETTINIGSNEGQLVLPFTESAKGVYFISIFNQKNKYNSKFMK